jgi:OmpA-OmpF porin, OOP family
MYIAASVLLANVWLPLFEFVPNKPESKHLNVQVEILFASNSAVPAAGYAGVLASLGRSAIGTEDRFVVEGYTDSVGSNEYNLALAKARGEAIRSILLNEGIRSTRIRVAAYGKTCSLNIDKTVEDKARNRRVVIRTYPN